MSAPAHRLGATAGGRRDRASSLDGVEGASSPWPLADPTSSAGARQPIRVAVPWRSAAHGHRALRSF